MHSHDNMFDPWDAIVVSQKTRCANIWIVDNHGGRAIDGPNIKFIHKNSCLSKHKRNTQSCFKATLNLLLSILVIL
jgi:hypothetical protein